MSFTNKYLYLAIQKMFYQDGMNIFQMCRVLNAPYEQVHTILFDITRTLELDAFERFVHKPLTIMTLSELKPWLYNHEVRGENVDLVVRALFSTDSMSKVGRDFDIARNLAQYRFHKYEYDFRTILMRANIVLKDLPAGRALDGDACSPYYLTVLKKGQVT